MTNFPAPTCGVIDGAVHRYALRVFYEDTDAGGVVYHANYLRWFERARSDLLDLLAIDQRAALDAGDGLYTVAEVALRYHAPARLSDAVLIETRALSVGRVACVLEQVAWRNGVRLCSGSVKVGFIGPDGRPRKQPDAWRQAFLSLTPTAEALSSPGLVPVPEGQE